jgi:hypothetical protein
MISRARAHARARKAAAIRSQSPEWTSLMFSLQRWGAVGHTCMCAVGWLSLAAAPTFAITRR